MDGVSQPTPEPALPPQQAPGESPAPEQQAPPERPLAAGSKPTEVNVQALLPQLNSLQRFRSASTKALGLDKTVPEDEFIAAIERLKQQAATQAAGGYELSPEQAAQEKLLEQRAWAAASRDFGEDFVQQARHIQALVYNTGDVYELASSVREVVDQLVAARSGQATAPPAAQSAAQAPPQQSQERPGVDMEMGQPGWIASPDADDKPGSGDTEGFFRRAFARAR